MKFSYSNVCLSASIHNASDPAPKFFSLVVFATRRRSVAHLPVKINTASYVNAVIREAGLIIRVFNRIDCPNYIFFCSY